jgi:uncharacterized protein YndB with AHSA1/START domain
METSTKNLITVEVLVNAPVEKVWKHWTEPLSIMQWCQASDDWHAPHAENDLRVNGKFTTTMAAKDGSMKFDFDGVYTAVDHLKLINYTIADGRTVSIKFEPQGDKTRVIETFEAEGTHPLEMQRGGWQAILDNFKKHTESH